MERKEIDQTVDRRQANNTVKAERNRPVNEMKGKTVRGKGHLRKRERERESERENKGE